MRSLNYLEKTTLKGFLVLMASLTVSAGAFACPGAMIQLNDSTVLTGNGILNIANDTQMTISDLADKHMIGKTISVSDKFGKPTHSVFILGSHGDSKGVMFTSYLVREISPADENKNRTEEEMAQMNSKVTEDRVLVLHSNYLGNGISAKDFPPQSKTKKDSTFSTLEQAGCD